VKFAAARAYAFHEQLHGGEADNLSCRLHRLFWRTVQRMKTKHAFIGDPQRFSAVASM